jgi:hypothetical protein
MRARLVHGAKFRRAGRLVARKYPMLQGAFVSSIHRLSPAKFGHTVHMRLTPADARHREPVMDADHGLRAVR